jgi:hypothetical protein
MREVQFKRAVFRRYLNATPNASLEDTDTLVKFGSICTQNAMRRSDPPSAFAYPRGGKASYCAQTFGLFTPVVGVSAGVAPDFGMTVSFMVVDGILGYSSCPRFQP